MRRITRSMTKDASGGSDTAASASTPHAVQDNKGNGSSSSSSDSQMMMSSANATQVNPLLMEDFLEKLFPFLNDRKTLTSVRLVNKTWNHASTPALKNALTWRVGPNKNGEQRFLEAMSKISVEDRGRTFRNFALSHRSANLPEGSGYVGEHVDKFMQEFGPYMINLKMKSMDIDYVRAHLKQTFLTNLEQLEFYDMSKEVLADPALFENTCLFTKVNTLSFNPTRDRFTEEEGRFSEGEGRICFNLVKACPNLRQLEINLRRTTLKILRDVNFELNLTSLTSLKNTLADIDYDTSTVILRPLDFYALVHKCPNLKVLSVNLSDVASKTEISQMLSKYSAQLEELYISILEEGEGSREFGEVAEHGNSHPDWKLSSEKSEEEEEEDEQKVGKRKREAMKSAKNKCKSMKKIKTYGLSFPDFPLLKKLKIVSWFYNDLDKLGSMPLLEKVELQMKDGVALQLGSTPAVRYPTVKSLKFRSAPVLNRYSGSVFTSDYEKWLQAPMVAPLISIFPNITELDVEVGTDTALRSLFNALSGPGRGGGQLKRLHLNDSQISDDGMTGINCIRWILLGQIKKTHATILLSLDDLVAKYRRYPFIGLLTGLQELTYKGNNLTNLSVEFGLVSLKELTSLKFHPYKPILPAIHCCGPNHVYPERFLVDVRALVDNLTYLVKLDVNDNIDRELERRINDEPESGPKRPKHKFKGCGISVQDLHYVREHAPNLEIVYGELEITR